MIRINLLQRRERRGLPLPDLSRVRELDLKTLLRERVLYLVAVVGFAAVGVEALYAYKIKKEVGSLRVEVEELTKERDRLKKNLEIVESQSNAIKAEMEEVKNRIAYLEQSKSILTLLKGYYRYFNGSLGYLYDVTPSTVWFDGLSQNMDFEKVDVELDFGSYSIDSIKGFYSLIKKEFPSLLPGEIKRQENKSGITYYLSSVKAKKDIVGGGE